MSLSNFRAAASTTGNSTSWSLTLPSLIQTGDLMVLTVSVSDTYTLATPSGWTAVMTPITSGTCRTYVWWRTAQAGDIPGSVSGTIGGTTTKYDAAVAAYSGADTVTPIQVVQTFVETVAGTTHTTPAITATAAGGWAINIATSKFSSPTGAIVPPSGYVSRTGALGSGGGSFTVDISDGDTTVATGTIAASTWSAPDSTASATSVRLIINAGSTALSSVALWYPKALQQVVAGFNYLSDTIKIVLVGGAFTYDASHQYYSDIVANEVATGNGYTAGGVTLGSKAVTFISGTKRTVLSAAAPVWTQTGGQTLTSLGAVILKSTGTNSTSPLLAFLDFGGTVSTTSSLTINPDVVNGFMSLSA